MVDRANRRHRGGEMLILASTSPRRKRLLNEAGYRFRAVRPSYQEKDRKGETPFAAVKRHALEKARGVAAGRRDALVIGADTIVYFRGRIIGKPKNMRDAARTLKRLAGRTHTVYTGVAVIEDRRGRPAERYFHETTRVSLKSLSDKEIRAYFKRVNPLDKAGAYAIQSRHTGIVTGVKGLFSNAVGLPLERLYAKLKPYKRKRKR